jgi:hypothetical protein
MIKLEVMRCRILLLSFSLSCASCELPSYGAYSMARDTDAGSIAPPADPCANRCQNGGVCVADGATVRCDCLAGWEGDSCQLNHNDCEPNPCMNGGTCSDGVASFSCACGNGFTGANCSDAIRATCKEVLQNNSEASSGNYLLDPDGIGVGAAPFDTVCDMSKDGGGWTLVGRELVGQGGTFKFLNLNSGDPEAAALGEGSALMGVRFSGLYQEVRLNWSGQSTGFIRFTIDQDMFADTVNTAIPISDLTTSDAALTSWVTGDGGAIFCRASSYSQVRPGDTSWAIKPQADTHTTCGCNSYGWLGRGAFYGGHADNTTCNPGGGSWAAIRDNGEQKGGILSYGLDIWVR